MDNDDRKTMPQLIGKVILTFCRLYLGGWMVVSGTSYWRTALGMSPIFPQPFGTLPESNELLVTMVHTHFFHIVKTCEILGGLSLILGIFVPVGLLMLLPVSFVVWYNAIVLNHRFDKMFTPYMGVGCLYMNLILMVWYIKYYLPMMTFKTTIGRIGDWKKLPKIFKSAAVDLI
ncbi:DoxX family membrane protein [Paraburkholderia sp. JPY432]|uniref:DoxX family membrane protein n=1 Tax=Paraburkholderia TaxID=1822464 RepID=UPI001595954D|nr:DoxX family membrane protein [Paraburkholderia youngii]NVH77212.1 DoxX family membrane protein [Paraburkholderia youngii]